jgi:HEPN domain-containing protein/predicted nucleotidyltransferase
VRKDTANWIALADYDIETARHMLTTERYLYVIFLCHLALEKLLKAHVAEVTQTLPIKTHDLIYLVKKSELEIPEKHLVFIGKINTASIPTRYPDDLQPRIEGISKIGRQELPKSNHGTCQMAKATPELKRVVNRYRTQLEKMGIRSTRVLLYGSQAAGTAREGSDIDLIVISGDWEKYNNRQRLELLGIAAARILEPVQAQGFTPSEIESKKVTPFWQQVIKEQAIAI